MKETIKLVKPINYNEQEITSVTLDLDSLTGADLIEVERQFVTANPINEAVQIKEYSKEYQIMVAAKASGLPLETIQKIGARDFSTITYTVQRFFTAAVSVE